MSIRYPVGKKKEYYAPYLYLYLYLFRTHLFNPNNTVCSYSVHSVTSLASSQSDCNVQDYERKLLQLCCNNSMTEIEYRLFFLLATATAA